MNDQKSTPPDDFFDTEDFRDHVSTIDEKGRRVWLYPKKPKGRFTNWRHLSSYLYLAVFFILPFIKWKGEPLVMLNVVERKFILFGFLFTPQDFHLFALLFLTGMVFVILFTVVFGRLFCGWGCPQTVFMELVYRRIEYAIEGDTGEQRRLNNGPWTAEKWRKKIFKHTLFFGIAVIIANWFLAYIIGMDEVKKLVTEPLSQHVGGFAAMLIFSFLFYGVFAFMREQVCTTICPYGRMQGVLLVKESIVVAYDFIRGEPRGKLKKAKSATETAFPLPVVDASASKTQGDCIDCKLCIHVCPTGIDIRNGTQLECVNCTACIDACDEVMDKVSKPRGLIRYDSISNIEKGGPQKLITTRVLAYSFVLASLVGLDVFLLSRRSDIEAIILRAPGQTYQEHGPDSLSNLYSFELINKSTRSMPVEIRLDGAGQLRFIGHPPETVEKGQTAKGSFFIDLPNSAAQGRKIELRLQVLSDGKTVDEVKTNFFGRGGR